MYNSPFVFDFSLTSIMISQFKLLWIPAVILSFSCYAQTTTRITGIVRDALTNKPIQNVNVYFDNTTIGAATDSTGSFLIADAPLLGSDLVFSHIGYKTAVVSNLTPPASGSLRVDVKMAPEAKTLAPVTLVARRKEWSLDYNLFKKIFLGTTPNAALTKILNPEVLSFERVDKQDGVSVFKANATAPLEIENKALGYHLTVTLIDFESNGASYNIVMNTRFDTLAARNNLVRNRWKQNRLDSYEGSQLHLFRSIIKGNYEQEGFRIVRNPEGTTSSYQRPAPLRDVVVDSSRSDLKILRKGFYQVKYLNKKQPVSQRANPNEPFPLSIIRVEDDYLRLYPSGLVKLPASYWRSGYLYNFRMADLLPFNYDGETEEKNYALNESREYSAIHGKVVDEQGEPLIGAEVFVVKGLNHTLTNAWGEFELAGLDPGWYNIGFADEGMEPTTRVIQASIDNPSEVVVELAQQKSIQRNYKNVDLPHRLEYIGRIQARLSRQSKIPGALIIKNPSAIQFEPQKKSIAFWATAPLIIESPVLGYQWTYFFESGSLTKSTLQLSGLVKMESVDVRNEQQLNRVEGNRLDYYQGSWNHIVTSLLEGRTSPEGFNFYQLKQGYGYRKPRFKNLPATVVTTIEPDSIITASKGRFFLRNLHGLEVHNENKTYSEKFYKGQTRQVLRFLSDSTAVNITKTGIADPASLQIAGLPNPILPTVPVDYRPRNKYGSNPDVLVYVREENLKAVKNLLEKVYLQTDKAFYYPGDTIWFKAYLKYSSLRYRDSLSTVLYVDLMSPTGEVLTTAVSRIKEGQAWGDIAIASNVTSGDFYLRAYTNWMRNFNEFMFQPVPILSLGNFISLSTTETATQHDSSLQVIVTNDKLKYGKREQVTLDVCITKNDSPIDGSFSISVTDQSVAPDIDGRRNILSINDPFKSDGATMIRLTHPVERGIVLRGKIDKANPRTEFILTTILANGQNSSITPVTGGDFMMALDFTDTTTAIIQCKTKDGDFAIVEIEPRESVKSYDLPKPLTYTLSGSDFNRNQINSLQNADGTRILQEVIVGAKRIPGQQTKEVTWTQKSFGFPFKVIQGIEIEGLRNTGNLLDYLSLRVPDFYHTYNQIMTRPSGSRDPTLTVDTPTVSRNKIYKFYWNGQQISLDDLDLIPSTFVSRIEVYFAPGASENRVAIYTEPVIPHVVPNFVRYLVRGYDIPSVFKEPSKQISIPDYRATIYWNPNIKVEPSGKASVLFRTSDVESIFKVTIEGVTSQGEFFRAVKYFDTSR